MTRHAPPSVPRDAWTQHPHWPEQVLLVGSHANFRGISAFLVEQAEHSGKGYAWTNIDSLLRRWVAAMRSHESYEEHKLYPYLAHRWDLDFEPCQRGHEALHAAYDAVIEVLQAGEEHKGAWTKLATALRHHHEVLDAHLDLEEDIVVPALLGMEPAEFHRYTSLSLRQLMDHASS